MENTKVKYTNVEQFVQFMHKNQLSELVAEKCDVTLAAVWAWVRENKVPDDKKIKIVKAFNLDPSILLN